MANFEEPTVPGEGDEDPEDFQAGSSFCWTPEPLLHPTTGVPG